MSWIVSGLVLLLSVSGSFSQSDVETGDTSQVCKIEGKVVPPENPPPDWHSVTTVTIDGGKRRSFLKEDNSFVFQVFSLRSQTDKFYHHFLGFDSRELSS